MAIVNARICSVVLFACFLLTRIAAAQSVSPAGIPKIAVEKYKLPNGLEVILSEDHRLPLVAVNVWYHVGPANEVSGRTGFAHLFEHMMYEGAKHVGAGAHFRLLSEAGASTMNGTTNFDRTNYYQTVPSNQLELVLWLESDRMGYLLDKLDQTKLSNQQDVVRNERRQSRENRPYGIVEEGMYHQLFTVSHPYYAGIIGSHADIQAASLDDVREFSRRYYIPNNATISIAGDFDHENAKSLINKYFGTLRSGAVAPKPRNTTPRISAERRAVVKDRIELERVYLAWITPPVLQRGNAEGDMASLIMGDGNSSRLYKRLVYEKQAAQDVSGWQASLALGSMFVLQATAKPGHTAEELEKLIDEELERFKREGPSKIEVEGARNIIESRILTWIESLNGLADQLNYYNHYVGKPNYLANHIEGYRRATASGIRTFANEQLKRSARVVVYGIPGPQDLEPLVPSSKPQAAAVNAPPVSTNDDEAWRNQMPKAGVSRPLQLPVAATFKLANGLTVFHIQQGTLPVVAAKLVTLTGSDGNPIDKPGIASFTAAMLNQGTPTRTATQIADEIARLGANLETSSTMDSLMVSVRSLKRSFPAALNVLADFVVRPSFPAAEVARQRATRLALVVQRREDASMLADDTMASALYGPKHPYGYAEIGTEASLKVIEQADLQAFWKQNLVPNNSGLVVAGDIDQSELRVLVEKAFGSWSAGTPVSPQLQINRSASPRLILVDKPGAAQTQLRIATPGPARSTPDYATLEIMNAALGGMFSSRINMNLRQQKGYTYGASSTFNYRRFGGSFVVRTAVRTDVTAPALAEVFKELGRGAQDPLSDAEFAAAKNSIVLALPGRFATTSQVVSSYGDAFIYRLGGDYFSKLGGMYSAVTLEEARKAAEKYSSAEQFIVIAVGDRTTIEPELVKLNIGQILTKAVEK
jgi:zinc protease